MTSQYNEREIELRRQVLAAVRKYHQEVYGEKASFLPQDRIPYAGRIFDDDEMTLLADAALDFWLTSGRYADRFEKGLANFLNIPYCAFVNSGSSANLLAFMALTSPIHGDRRIRRGDEVITVACGFPTTVAPIFQFGSVPVFVDISLPTYNIDVAQLQAALSKKTKAVMIAHTLGNPFDLRSVRTFCDKHGLWLIEDNCDALGAKYFFEGHWRYTGTLGHIGTSSFYPSHHITTGEGGAVYTHDPELHRIVTSLRDWGRDCCCPPGTDNFCGNRFNRQYGALPQGYDHKYVYSHFGYNLKATEMQAAIGCAQLNKLSGFIEMRKRNWNLLRDGLADLEKYFILPEPTEDSDPSWFGFALTLRPGAPFTRDEIVRHLEQKGIQTRMMFAGNLTKHPCCEVMKEGFHYRVVGELLKTDQVMERTFWVGVYPGLRQAQIEYILNTINELLINLHGISGG